VQNIFLAVNLTSFNEFANKNRSWNGS